MAIWREQANAPAITPSQLSLPDLELKLSRARILERPGGWARIAPSLAEVIGVNLQERAVGLLTLPALYQQGYKVGRYINLERLVEPAK